MCFCVYIYILFIYVSGDSLVAQTVKNPPTMQETQVQSLGQEDLLEKEMTPHSSIPSWRIPWTEEPGGLQSMGSQRVGHISATITFTRVCVCVCMCVYVGPLSAHFLKLVF